MSDISKIEWTQATWHEKTAAKRIGVPASEYVARIALGQKWCTRCKDWHARSFFRRDLSRGDGLAASCKGSRNSTNPIQAAENRRRKYREYYAGTGGAAIRSRVYARKRGTQAIPPELREFLFEAFDGQCAYCPNVASTIDHIVPVIKGGPSARGNLLPACRSCNSRKKARDFDHFVATLDGLKADLIQDEIAMLDVLGEYSFGDLWEVTDADKN